MTVFFSRRFLARFFFLGKVYKSLTHSLENDVFFSRPGKKKPGFFTHSFDFGQKFPKNNLFPGNKKIRYLWPTSKKKMANFFCWLAKLFFSKKLFFQVFFFQKKRANKSQNGQHSEKPTPEWSRFFLVNRVENQKLNQTTAELPFS